MLADAEHSLDRDVISADRDRLFDRLEDGNVELLRQRAGHVALRKLIDVQRRQPERRTGASVLFPSFEDLADDDVGVGPLPIDGHHGRDRFGFERLGTLRPSRTAADTQEHAAAERCAFNRSQTTMILRPI